MIVSSSWSILVAKHKRVSAVHDALFSYGVDHFIPEIETLQIVHGKRRRMRRPLLGDYIPVAISSGWRSWLRIRDVRGMLLNDLGYPAQVLPREMERLRGMCTNGVYYENCSVDTGEFIYGQNVMPRDGPFVYQTGRYQGQVNKRGDCSALFLLFGREQRVTFKAGDLIAV